MIKRPILRINRYTLAQDFKIIFGAGCHIANNRDVEHAIKRTLSVYEGISVYSSLLYGAGCIYFLQNREIETLLKKSHFLVNSAMHLASYYQLHGDRIS